MEGASHQDGGGTSRGRGGNEVGWALAVSAATLDLGATPSPMGGSSPRAAASSATRAVAVAGRWQGSLARPPARERSTASGRYGFTARGGGFGFLKSSTLAGFRSRWTTPRPCA